MDLKASHEFLWKGAGGRCTSCGEENELTHCRRSDLDQAALLEPLGLTVMRDHING